MGIDFFMGLLSKNFVYIMFKWLLYYTTKISTHSCLGFPNTTKIWNLEINYPYGIYNGGMV